MAAFTTIAAGIGAATTALGTGMSFAQAGEQKRLQKEAEAKAEQAMQEARKKLEINYADELAIMKEPYELAREAMLSQGALALQAGLESDRGAEATAGKVQMAQNQGQQDIRTQMGQDLMEIERARIAEEGRLRDIGLSLDLGEIEGAQLAARSAENRANLATQQGFQGLTSTIGQVASMIPLFGKTASTREFEGMAEAAKAEGVSQTDFQKNIASLSNDPRFAKLSGVGAQAPDAFAAFMSSLNKDELEAINQELMSRMGAAKGLAPQLSNVRLYR